MKQAKGKIKGRPKAIIDFDMVDRYLMAQCTGSGIAGLIGIHPDTLYKEVERKFKITFSAYQQQKRTEGKELLRMKMWNQAMQGNTTTLIWLSKQYLGFTDKSNVNVDIERMSEAELMAVANTIINAQKN